MPTYTPPEGGYTAYRPKQGLDPIFDAWKAIYAARLANAAGDATFETTQLQDEYTRGIAELDNEIPGARRNLEASLLTRGIGRGGEALRRRAEQEAGFTSRRTGAERARLEGIAALEQRLARQYDDYAAQNEVEIGQSRERLRQRGVEVPDAETPGYTPPPKPKQPKQPKKPKKPKKKDSGYVLGAFPTGPGYMWPA